jgi:hypothetical protein
MARCCEVCGKALEHHGYIVNICYWDGTFSSHEQCCYQSYEELNRIESYYERIETPDPTAVREIIVTFTYFQEDDE